jgi:hypothetical protein
MYAHRVGGLAVVYGLFGFQKSTQWGGGATHTEQIPFQNISRGYGILQDLHKYGVQQATP